MARQIFKIHVEAAGRSYEATGTADSRQANPSANAQRKAQAALVAAFPELEGHCLHITSVTDTDVDSKPRKLPTQDELDDRKRGVYLWRLAGNAQADPMADLMTTYEKYRGNKRYAAAAELLSSHVEGVMEADIRRAWSENILDSLRTAEAIVADDHAHFQMSGGYRVRDGRRFDEIIADYAKRALAKVLAHQGHSSGQATNIRERVEHNVVVRLYEFLTEGGMF